MLAYRHLSCTRLSHHDPLHPVCPVMSCITCSVVGLSCARELYSIFVPWVQGKALCASFKCTQLKRCAASEADEERASPERSMWMPGRQRNTVWLCVHFCTEMHLTVHLQAEPGASWISLSYLVSSLHVSKLHSKRQRSFHHVNETVLHWAHSSLQALIVACSGDWGRA